MEYILRLGESGLKQDLLIYGKQYRLKRDGESIGTARYVHDTIHGDVFLKEIIVKGRAGFAVFAADEWELVS